MVDQIEEPKKYKEFLATVMPPKIPKSSQQLRATYAKYTAKSRF